MSDTSLDDLAQLTPTLASLGWTDDLDRWADEVDAGTEDGDLVDGADDGDLVRGRLARVDRGFSLVFTGGDALLAASGSDRVELDIAPATGDFVVVADDPDDGPIVAAVAERRTALVRRASGRVPEPQVLAANADTVFVMHGLDRDLNLRRLERQLVIAWDSGATPVVVLTKADTVDDPEAPVTEVAEIAPGVEVVAVSTVTGYQVDLLRPYLADNATVALMGLSGIGKSSLVNALSDGRVQRVGEVRASDRRGRHTTVSRELIPLPGGGFLIDTPGVREIGLWQASDGIDLAFPEIAAAAAECRFADCNHEAEPGCEVRARLTAGQIPERRLDHWRELQAELDLQETQLEDFARRAEGRHRAAAEDERDQARSSRRTRNRRSGRSGGGSGSRRRGGRRR